MPGAARIRSRHLIRVTIALITAMAGLLVMVQAAEASWSAIHIVSPRGWEGEDGPSLAVDGNGNTLLAWVAYKSGSDGALFQLQTRIRSHTGKLGRIRPLSPLRATEVWPKAAADARGDRAVIWSNGSQLQGRRLSPSGSAGPLRVLSPPGSTVETWGIVMAPSGAALAVWWELRNGTQELVARYFFKNGSLGRVIGLGGGDLAWPTVTIDRLGTATVAWSAADELVACRIRPGKVSPRRVIMPASSSGVFIAGSIADDASGDTVLAFTRGGNSQRNLMVRVWRSGGRLSPARSIARNDDTVYSYVAVATDGRGASIVTWTHYNSSIKSDVAFGRRVSLTGGLGRVVRLGTGYAPVTSIDPAGAGMVAWQSTPVPQPGSTGYGLTHIHARRFAAASGTFGRQFTLTADGDSAHLGEGRTGKIAAIWQQSTLPWPIRARFGP